MLHSPSGYSYSVLYYTVKCIYAVIFTPLNIEKYLFSNYFPNLKVTYFNYSNSVIVP